MLAEFLQQNFNHWTNGMYYVAVPMLSKHITLYHWMPADIINDAIRSHPKRALCLNFSIKKL